MTEELIRGKLISILWFLFDRASVEFARDNKTDKRVTGDEATEEARL